MTLTHIASLSFPTGERRRRVLYESIAPEVGEIDDDRSRASVHCTDEAVAVEVEAADLVALRASLNTWIRLVETAERIADAGDAHRGSEPVDPPNADGDRRRVDTDGDR